MYSQDNTPILSISILTAGIKDTLWKSLQSLEQLRKNINCELIIIDTGCEVCVRQCIDKIADKVISFSWCNDFSKARNVGLKIAKGEWFLYLDDDEWFIDTDDIILFFKTGDYKKYKSASYITRNYCDWEEKYYQDNRALRMIKIEPRIKFEGIIHEHFSSVEEPTKYLNSIVKHFGYIFNTKEERDKHAKRNIELLRKSINEKEDDIRGWIHLFQEYYYLEDYDTLLKESFNLLDKIEKIDNPYINKHRPAVHLGILNSYLKKKEIDRALVYLREIEKDRKNTPLSKASFAVIGAELYFNKKQYKEAIEYVSRYRDIVKIYMMKESEAYQQYTFFVKEVMTKEVREKIEIISIFSNLYLGILDNNIEELKWKDLKLELNIVEEYINHLIKETNDNNKQIFFKLLECEENKKKIIEYLKKQENNINSDSFYSMIQEIQEEDVYFLILKVKGIRGKNIDLKIVKEYFYLLIEKTDDFFIYSDEIFDIVREYNIDLEKIYFNLPFRKWKNSIDLLIEFGKDDNFKNIKIIQRESKNKNHIRWKYYEMKLAVRKLYHKWDKIGIEELEERLFLYIDSQINYYNLIFRKEVIEKELEVLPESLLFAVKIKKFLGNENLTLENIKTCLKECRDIDPNANKVLQKYIKLSVERIQNKMEERKHINSELMVLSDQVKDRIKQLIEAGKLEEAKVCLVQLKKILSEDHEIDLLEKIINEKG